MLIVYIKSNKSINHAKYALNNMFNNIIKSVLIEVVPCDP